MAEVRIKFSNALTPATKNEGETTLTFEDGSTVSSVLDSLSEKYGDGFKKKVFDDSGNVRKFVAIYQNGEDIRFAEGVETKVSAGDELLVLPAVTGG